MAGRKLASMTVPKPVSAAAPPSVTVAFKTDLREVLKSISLPIPSPPSYEFGSMNRASSDFLTSVHGAHRYQFT